MKLKPKRSSVFIGIDPGKDGGVAISTNGQTIVTMPTKNGQVPYEIEAHADAGCFAFIVVERSHCKLPRFRSHRSDANEIASAVKALFSRRNRLVFVDPQTWQGWLGVTGPKNPKGLNYRGYSLEFLGGHPSDTENEHAARCILHWALKVWPWGKT